MSRLPIYVTVEVNEPFKFEQELQQRAIEGPQPGDEPSVYETRGIRTL
jgi:hypothetical protein